MRPERLRDAVALLLLPPEDEMRVLRLCLVGGEAACRGVEGWLASMADPRQRLGALDLPYRRMLALLHEGVNRNKIDVSRQVTVYLRIAQTRERARNQAYWEQCGEVLATLRCAEVEAVPIRGTAAAIHAYPALHLRHSHDVDLLIPERGLRSAAEALRREGYHTCRVPLPGTRDQLAAMRHPSGLDFVLHTTVRRYTGAGETFDDARPLLRETRVPVLRDPLMAPSAELTLVHALQQLYYLPSPKSMFLFVDLWFLLSRAGELDWMTIENEVRARSLGAACLIALDFLDRLTALTAPARQRLNALGELATPREWAYLARLLGYGPRRTLRLLRGNGAGLRGLVEYASGSASRYLRQRGAAMLRHG